MTHIFWQCTKTSAFPRAIPSCTYLSWKSIVSFSWSIKISANKTISLPFIFEASNVFKNLIFCKTLKKKYYRREMAETTLFFVFVFWTARNFARPFPRGTSEKFQIWKILYNVYINVIITVDWLLAYTFYVINFNL
jgi:hypothetical protein